MDESTDMNFALPFGLGFEIEQPAELIAQMKQRSERGMLINQVLSSCGLLGTKPTGRPAQTAQMSTVPVNLRGDGTDHLHEVSID